jgi:hypothetical protein
MPDKASASASPTAQARPADEAALTEVVPQPETPAEGALVDAKTVPFAWSEVPGADNYVLQVAADPNFEDVLVTLSTGPTTALTLYDTLHPHDETDLHWRVRAESARRWSPTACFRPISDRVIAEHRARREQEAAARAEAFVQRETVDIHRPPEEEPLVSDRMALVVLATIVLSFLLLLAVLFVFGQVIYPPEATGL